MSRLKFIREYDPAKHTVQQMQDALRLICLRAYISPNDRFGVYMERDDNDDPMSLEIRINARGNKTIEKLIKNLNGNPNVYVFTEGQDGFRAFSFSLGRLCKTQTRW